MYETRTKDSMSLSKTKKELANWIERDNAVSYACKLHQLRITIAEALYIMSANTELVEPVGWRYQEDVVREMIELEQGALGLHLESYET